MNILNQNKLFYSILFASLFLLYSCEDVITVEPSIADSQLVIDAWVDDRNTEQTITLTESQQYFDNSEPISVNNATVSITRDDGSTFEFINQGEGKYIWTPEGDESMGTPGDSYTLTIVLNGETYIANTIMKRVPTVDSITQEFIDDDIINDDGIYVEFFARDFEGTGDAYWIKAFKNGEFLNRASQLNIAFDAGFDAGSQLDGIIFIPPIRDFINELNEDDLGIPWNPGEVSKVEIHSLSNDAFNFLEIARDQINNGSNGIFSLPLANTRTNIVNTTGGSEPLGLFNVAAVSSLEKVIE